MILSPSMNFATTIAPPPSMLADFPTKKYRKTTISAPSRKIRLSPSRTVSLSVVNPAAKARPPTLPLYFIYDRSQYARLATKSAQESYRTTIPAKRENECFLVAESTRSVLTVARKWYRSYAPMDEIERVRAHTDARNAVAALNQKS